MSNILDTIVRAKQREVAERKALFTPALLEKSISFNATPVSLIKHLHRPDQSGIIAEYKRKSPSRGIINDQARVEEVTIGYVEAGASGLSILTDQEFFGGKTEDLVTARSLNHCPILRKDFIIDPYQVTESKSMGADVILLIAAILKPAETLQLAWQARLLGMETILEVHHADELYQINDYISMVGVNNRNLRDFSVSLETSLQLKEMIPPGITAIAESGIHRPEDLILLKKAGYQGFLVGELFMKSADPAGACRDFIHQLRLIS
jgi:indole-3-glycerol phosphate synthase